MKKLTRLHAILIILLVVVLAVTFYFSFSYRGVEAKQPDIRNEIAQALMRLDLVKEENNPEPLKKQLDELRAVINEMSRNEPLFPERPPTVQIGDLIVDSAEKLNLVLLKISPNDKAETVTIKSDKDSKDSQGNEYSKAEYEVKVKGDLARINSLIGEIEGADFGTLTIEDMGITYVEKEDEERTLSWWEGEFTVVTLYQYDEEE